MSKFDETVFDDIVNGLEKYRGFYAQDYNVDISDNIESLKKRIEASKEEGRVLKIGIVGEVKAGKSSFLNALVFEGEDILPKACTPMTAALTKITYGERQSAVIHFYGEKAWKKIEDYSIEYDKQFESEYAIYAEKVKSSNERNPSIYKAVKSRAEQRKTIEIQMPRWLVGCKELVEMSMQTDIDISTVLDTCKELEIEDVKKDLEEYVGAQGRYTPLVEYVEIKMNDERFKEVEIVDTPGLNDPIVSRSEKTRKFLSECDVVFLLSYSGQFLTEADLNFMSKTLPREGIRNIVIVGSKFDAGMLDDNKSKGIQQARLNLGRILNSQAQNNVAKCFNNKYHSDIAKRMEESLPPSYVSSLLYSCAIKMKQGVPLDELENHILKNLEKRFDDFSRDEKSLLKLSGFTEIQKKCARIMSEKKSIIDERDSKILADGKNVLLGILEDINIQAVQNRDSIKNSDKNKLEKKKSLIEKNMNDIRKNVKNIFSFYSINTEKLMKQMKVEIAEEVNNHQGLYISSETHTETEIVSSWFGLKKDRYTYEVTTHTASVSDSISNVRNYVNACQRYINDELEKIISARKIKEDLTHTVIGAFDLSDVSFNENDILMPLEIVVKKMQIPKISINNEQFEKEIIGQFEVSVHDEDINKLKLAQNIALGKASEGIKYEIDRNVTEIQNIFTKEAATFVDNILNKLNENMSNISRLIDDKENSVKAYDELLTDIQKFKKRLCEVE